MPILPALEPMFAAMSDVPAPQDVPIAELRASMDAMVEQSYGALMAAQAPLPLERDIQIPLVDGEITLRIYSTGETGNPRPCHLYFHGGGFWMGTLEQGDNSCRGIADAADCVVVSVDYRLAPEHKFPAAAEDAYAALLWVAGHGADWGIDPTRISVGGGSAGGNLAAVVSIMARDRSGPRPVLQVLEIPVTDFSKDVPLDFPHENLVINSGKDHYGALYLARPEDAANPYASPLLAADLADLPPALVIVAEYDPLQPEGEQYARRLEEAGVEVEFRCGKGQFHGSQALAALIPQEAEAHRRQVITALRGAYGLAVI